MEIISENTSLVDITWSPLPGLSGSPLLHVVMVQPLGPSLQGCLPELSPRGSFPFLLHRGPRPAEGPAEVRLKASRLPEASYGAKRLKKCLVFCRSCSCLLLFLGWGLRPAVLIPRMGLRPFEQLCQTQTPSLLQVRHAS